MGHPIEFDARGVVLELGDFTLDWPALAARAGLNLIGLHKPESEMPSLAGSPRGIDLLERCAGNGISVETEIHAISHLMPRDLFAAHPEWFRLDQWTRRREPDFNLCPSSKEALKRVADAAADWAAHVPSTTGRFYFWPDDNRSWCHCDSCARLGDSDQALIVANAIATAIRRVMSEARVAYLAYMGTLEPPCEIRPEKGVFLEFAPYRRCWKHPISSRDCAVNRRQTEVLESLLNVFGTGGAQILEYWLDVSLFSGYRRPAGKLPPNCDVLKDDLRFYHSLGIRRVTTFACWLDAEYAGKFGDADVMRYGQCFKELADGG
ncbi:MAG TPA: DUF4838 domain-containing protein [Candidatus Brocadiia bacterium]|nr:DUF4838 domain-containing protein [Candidatus Brocadiia bacterium]